MLHALLAEAGRGPELADAFILDRDTWEARYVQRLNGAPVADLPTQPAERALTGAEIDTCADAVVALYGLQRTRPAAFRGLVAAIHRAAKHDQLQGGR